MNIKLTCGSELITSVWSGEFPPTIEQLLKLAKKTHPQPVASWFDAQGRVRTSLTVFVNGENIRYRQGLQTELKDGDKVHVIPLIAGG
jgi:molybdopterin converting factor small subunit